MLKITVDDAVIIDEEKWMKVMDPEEVSEGLF
jgi:hypothetical protein